MGAEEKCIILTIFFFWILGHNIAWENAVEALGRDKYNWQPQLIPVVNEMWEAPEVRVFSYNDHAFGIGLRKMSKGFGKKCRFCYLLWSLRVNISLGVCWNVQETILRHNKTTKLWLVLRKLLQAFTIKFVFSGM